MGAFLFVKLRAYRIKSVKGLDHHPIGGVSTGLLLKASEGLRKG
ncbi:hypothetical protein MED297_07218 [Reinekea sp. MED297]|uniref:Uncharacterized protein n=1 Tax=Reinekea blandensis MED297 TaxID=314283 RepID=A4BFE0_9GAMM|nr:hypothetical protein MED297_07218 [Reinekea sp. MED297] [Reinekea blandensis MED297]